MKPVVLIISLIMGMAILSCEKEDEARSPEVNYNPVINSSNFVDSVTNIYFPLHPGMVYTYTAQTEDGEESIVVSVLTETKIVSGVKCTVVHDVVSIQDQVIEDTYDWYAQDKDGNVWYMGEDVTNYENGKMVDKEGSFEAGVDGAKPGIIMLAHPVLEMPYRQEYYFGIAEDWGKVIAKDLTITVPYGTFENCIKTEDWNALEPDSPVEYKYYAPGIGVTKEEAADGSEVVELITVTMQ
jgi:hypothetical protein